MDLTILQFESWQVPHREISKFTLARIQQKAFGHGAKKAPISVLAPDPTGMIHVCCESPSWPPPSSTLVARNHVAVGVVLDSHVRAYPQLRDDRIAHRILVKRGGRLVEKSTDHAQQFPALHGIKR